MSVYRVCSVCGRTCYCHQLDPDTLCVDCYGWLRRLVFYRVGVRITLDANFTLDGSSDIR